MLVTLIPQQSSKCKICNARKSVFLKEYKPNKKQKQFLQIINMLYCSKFKKHTDGVCPNKLVMMANINIKGTARGAECLAIKSFSDKITDKYELETIVTQFLLY